MTGNEQPRRHNGRHYQRRFGFVDWSRPSNRAGEYDEQTRQQVEEMATWVDGLEVVDAATTILRRAVGEGPTREIRRGEPGE